MSQSENAELFERALEMEPAKRLSLATKLLDSIEMPESEEWADSWASELDRRRALLESGQDSAVGWDTLKKRALANLAKR